VPPDGIWRNGKSRKRRSYSRWALGNFLSLQGGRKFRFPPVIHSSGPSPSRRSVECSQNSL